MKAGRIDLKSGDYADLLRAPDLRLTGLRWETIETDRPFFHDYPDTRRACCYFVQQGAAYVRTGPGDDQIHYVAEGTCVGIEGHAHQWMDASHVHISQVRQDNDGQNDLPFRMTASTIDRSAAVLKRLPNGAIIVPSHAKPYSTMIRGCVDLVEIHRASDEVEMGVVRRLAEVIMLQIIGYARSRLWPGPKPTGRALHDEYILRAMTAFFAAPNAKWTVASLADAAGLSRSAFSERFLRAFGESPLGTLNNIRLQQSAQMLLESNASLTTIASEIGFGSASAFLRAFKRKFGMTPVEWRNANRKD